MSDRGASVVSSGAFFRRRAQLTLCRRTVVYLASLRDQEIDVGALKSFNVGPEDLQQLKAKQFVVKELTKEASGSFKKRDFDDVPGDEEDGAEYLSKYRVPYTEAFRAKYELFKSIEDQAFHECRTLRYIHKAEAGKKWSGLFPRCFGFGKADDGRPVVLMENVGSTSLQNMAASELNFQQRAFIALQLSKAVQILHRNNLAHLDIKPGEWWTRRNAAHSGPHGNHRKHPGG